MAAEGADAGRPGRLRRFLLPALAAIAALSLVALLAYGVARQSPDRSIDESLARDQPVPLRPTVWLFCATACSGGA